MTTEPKIGGPYTIDLHGEIYCNGRLYMTRFESLQLSPLEIVAHVNRVHDDAYAAGFDAGAQQAIDQQKGGDNHVDS